MHVTGRAIMSFCIALVAGGVAIKALSWPLKAGLFPLIVSIPVCCLAFVDSLLTPIREGRQQRRISGLQILGGR